MKTTRWSCWPGPAHTIPDRCESSSTFCTTSPEPSLSPTSRESRRRSAAAAAESFCPSFSRVSFQQLNKVLTAKWETERISVYSSRARTIYPATASVGEGAMNVCSTRSPVSSISPLETVCGQMLTGEMRTFTYAYNQTQSTDVYSLFFYHLFHYLMTISIMYP